MGLRRGVRVDVHVPAAPDVPPDHRCPEQHQQPGHDDLRHGPESRRQLQVEHDDQADNHTDRHGMAGAPNQAQPGGAPEPAARTTCQGRDGRKMVRLKGMAESQQTTDGQNRYN